jgi:hypothetical protein
MKSRHGIIILLEIIGCSHRVAKPWLVPMELDRCRSMFVLDALIRTLLFIVSHINRSIQQLFIKSEALIVRLLMKYNLPR